MQFINFGIEISYLSSFEAMLLVSCKVGKNTAPKKENKFNSLTCKIIKNYIRMIGVNRLIRTTVYIKQRFKSRVVIPRS